MKQGTLITKIIMFILLAGVVIYLAIYAVQSLADPFTTAMAYQDVINNSVEITGMVVREEQALSDGADIMDVLPEEGERVASGETVAYLYQNSEALDRTQKLQALEQEREQLQRALNTGSSLGDAAKLEQQIISSILELRSSTASGDLSSLESNALSLRTLVLQREFAYSASGGSAAALNESLAALDLEIAQLETQASYDTTPISTPRSGLFSRLSDGLETTLTPASIETMTAKELLDISERSNSGKSSSVGKIITGDRWYFVAVVDPSLTNKLFPGNTITVSFSRDYTGEIDMLIERVGDEEPDGCVLVLSATHNLSDITLLRTQTVDLVFDRYVGIRVPKQALRMETRTTTNSDSGTETSEQFLVVYTVTGLQAEYKPVDILREGSDYYLVTPSKNAGDRILRPGDEIIVVAPDLYDGKVVLE